MAIRTYISIITLNVNGLNAPTKRYRGAEWRPKKITHVICCLQGTHFRSKDIYRLKVRGWGKSIPFKCKSKESWGSNTYIRLNRL